MTLWILTLLLGLLLAWLTFKYLELYDRMMDPGSRDLPYLAALSGCIDAQEGYDEIHARKVMEDAIRIGVNLGLAHETLSTLRIASLIHDCGEFQIPRDLLRTPRPLSPDEWELLKNHPVIGEAFVRACVSASDDVACTIRWHHERWDGTGYPDRLGGEEIPLTARILAVSDALNAMRAERPYRKARSERDIEQELSSQAGFMFDPAVVEACLQEKKGPS